jgi:hypothetical protein
MTYDQAREQADKLCRGIYQRGLIDGTQRWSGSDLKGTARNFGACYARSRGNLHQRMEKAGITFAIRRNETGTTELFLGDGEVAEAEALAVIAAWGRGEGGGKGCPYRKIQAEARPLVRALAAKIGETGTLALVNDWIGAGEGIKEMGLIGFLTAALAR